MEKLEIVVLDINHDQLKGVTFVDFYKMMEKVGDEETICDFGVYVSDIDAGSEALTLNLKKGDLVMFMNDEDFLSCTAAQFKTQLSKVGNSRISLTLGRNAAKEELNL